MAPSFHRCAVCSQTDHLEGVLVAGETLLLCTEHREKLGDAAPESFDDLALFFATLGADRRTSASRRSGERRMFPPRPELRRLGHGRRSGDPKG